MKFLEIFVIVIMLAVGMFGFAFMSGSSTSPTQITDTFGNSVNLTVSPVNTTDPNNSSAEITFENVTSYQMIQNMTAVETQSMGAGIIIVAACGILVLVFAMIVLMRGKYSKDRYRT